MLDRTVPPPSSRVTDVSLVEAQSHILHNQAKVHLLGAGAQPVAKIEVIFRAGSAIETLVGRSYFAAKMLLEGTTKHSAASLSEQFDFFGAFVDITAGLDFITISIHTPVRHFEAVAALLREILEESTFPEKELQTLKNLKIQELKVNLEKNNFIASRLIRRSVFGAEHPYGKSMEIADARATKRDEIETYYRESLLTCPEVIISGGVGAKELDLITTSLGGLAFRQPVKVTMTAQMAEEKMQVIEREMSMQSSIRMAMPIVGKAHPDHMGILVVNEILGGYFGSRLMKNIREDKGYTYGIHSSVANLQHQSMVIIGTDVKKEFTSETLKEIDHELNRLATEPVGEKELETVKNYMTGSFLSSINTPFSLADKFKAIYFHQLEYDYYQRYLRRVEDITSEQIQAIAGQYFAPDSIQKVVVGAMS